MVGVLNIGVVCVVNSVLFSGGIMWFGCIEVLVLMVILVGMLDGGDIVMCGDVMLIVGGVFVVGVIDVDGIVGFCGMLVKVGWIDGVLLIVIVSIGVLVVGDMLIVGLVRIEVIGGMVDFGIVDMCGDLMVVVGGRLFVMGFVLGGVVLFVVIGIGFDVLLMNGFVV